MTSVKLLREVYTDTGFNTTLLMTSSPPDLNPVDCFWSIMQEKVYQTHIANIDELKHRLIQVWAELTTDHRCSYSTVATLSQISMHVTRV